MNEIKVPISPGELLDKITILKIKSQRMADPKKLENVRAELQALEQIWNASPHAAVDVARDVQALLAVNERLWTIEDDIRTRSARKASMPSSCGSPARFTSRTTSGRRSSGA